LKIANLREDGDILSNTRMVAANILNEDPTLALPKNQILLQQLQIIYKRNTDYSAIS
jgi:hypothetical protein